MKMNYGMDMKINTGRKGKLNSMKMELIRKSTKQNLEKKLKEGKNWELIGKVLHSKRSQSQPERNI